jgi:Trk-type K+ transport system membrane component
MSILGSVLLYATAAGNLAYVDALLFASGANTQAGLNTVDVNLLNTFQQLVIFFCAMMSNPISIHTSVVFLRLYWFEKRFQNLVQDARHKRGTVSKAKVSTNPDPERADLGVNGRNITIMRNTAQPSRITNDGILLRSKDEDQVDPLQVEPLHDSRATLLGTQTSRENGEIDGVDEKPSPQEQDNGHSTQITFSNVVKRSDGLQPDLTKFPSKGQGGDGNGEMLRLQRTVDDDEILRIPNPRDAERGIKIKRLEKDDNPDVEDAEDGVQDGSETLNDTAVQSPTTTRQPTIVFKEPERRRRDEIAQEVRVIGNTFGPLKIRKPRIFSSRDKKIHRDSDSDSETERPPRHTLSRVRTTFSRDKLEDAPYLSWQPTLGRNSAFPGLTLEQREELGGIEYRSLRTLALVLVCYFWGFWLFGVACLMPWIKNSDYYTKIVENAGISPTWWGFFTSNSAFMDLGFTLTPDSMISFNQATFTLIIMSFLIVIGNTGFPVMLRLVIWILSLVVPKGTGVWEELRFLLDHPRRCFTLLFPSSASWWLFWILVVLNGLDLLLFVVVDVRPQETFQFILFSYMILTMDFFPPPRQLNTSVVSELPVGIRIVNGIFQAASTRTAGFACVNIALLHPAVQVSYLIMMYISVFPIAISIRRTNVYEEKSLGVYGKGDEEENPNENNALSYVGTHLRRQLSFDLWYVFLGMFILAISEAPKIQAKDFDMFAILFEIVSAYGTVGLSLGYPTVNASLCSQFSTVGKLVIIAMQIRGRHRGLPYGLDRAILLPSESRFEREAAEPALFRTNAVVSATPAIRRASLVRGRSRSTDRGRPSVITQLLHPGPPVLHDNPPKRTASVDAHQRSHTDLPSEGDDQPFGPSELRARPRRAATTAE